MTEEKSGAFTYTYSAKEQEEIRSIRSKYLPPEETATPMERLRRLDESATKGAAVVSLCVGIAGALVLGLGLSLIMVWGGGLFIPGVLVGLAGIAGVVAAYPIYNRMVKRKREKLAPEIIRLSDQLLK